MQSTVILEFRVNVFFSFRVNDNTGAKRKRDESDDESDLIDGKIKIEVELGESDESD